MKQSFKHNLQISWKFIKIIHSISKSYIPLTMLSIVLSSIISLVNVVFPKFIIDELIGGRDTAKIVLFVTLTICVNFFFNLITHFIGYYFEVQNQKVTSKLDIILGEKSMELDFDQVEQKENLELKERAMFVIRNQNALGRMIQSLRNIVQNVITILGLIAIISTLNIFVIVFITIILLFSSKIFQLQNRASFAMNQELIPVNRIFNYYSNLTTDFSAGKDIRIYHMQPLVLRKIDDFINKNLSSLRKLSQKEGKYQVLGSINLNVENICIYAYMCYRVFVQSISIGDFTMYINAINNFGNVVSGLVSQFFEFSNMCQYLDPFFAFLDLQPRSTDGARNMEVDPMNFELRFDHVSFAYPNTEKLVLDDVCVTIRPNERISIVGVNGAGKTTFVKLLTRLYRPTAGAIRLNGVDINEYRYEEYIKFFSVVFQDYKNYAFTIKENIALTQAEQVDEKTLHHILQELSLSEKVFSLKNGVNTSLYKIFDKEGIEFSGGEMQKIAIARANFKDAAIVILDEPTSALDPVIEYNIMNNLNNIIRNKTGLIVSHRLSSCRFSDRILVFNEGKIVQEGKHEMLIQEEDGLYYEMFSSQAQYYV